MPEVDAAFSSFEQKWFAAHPEYAVAAVFLPPEQRRRANAFGSLLHELEEAALQPHEPQVTGIKLGWWRNELASAAGGRASHPITRELFADARARTVDPAVWVQLAEAALATSMLPAAPAWPALLGQYRDFHASVARVDAGLMTAAATEQDLNRNATLWTISHLLRNLPAVMHGDEGLPVPLDLLARHALTRAALAEATPQRAALLRDHLDALAGTMDEVLGVPSPRSLYQRVRVRLDRKLIAAARGLPDPLSGLAGDARSGRWATLWTSWREARQLARDA
jgi:phytoene synthase